MGHCSDITGNVLIMVVGRGEGATADRIQRAHHNTANVQAKSYGNIIVIVCVVSDPIAGALGRPWRREEGVTIYKRL